MRHRSESSAAAACTTWPSSPIASSGRSTTPFGDPSGAVHAGDAARQARRVSAAPRRRPSPDAVGAELPRQHLRLQGARRRSDHLGERGRQPARGAARRSTSSFPISSSIARSTATPRSSATASSRTSASRIRSASRCACIDGGVRGAGRARRVHRGGTYVCMEGPQFSTLAESNLYRSWGAHIIGMTNLQEAKLAREAEICYTTMALVTDYDCWHPDHDSVTVEMIIAEPDAEREDGAAGDRRGGRGVRAGRAATAPAATRARDGRSSRAPRGDSGRASSATSRPSSGSTC